MSTGIRRVEQIMGMPIEIDVRQSISNDVLEEAFDWFRWVDDTFSTYRLESQISRLNAGTLPSSQVDPMVREVLAKCKELSRETNGYFDIHSKQLPFGIEADTGELIASGIDPSGYVKGWAVDRAAYILSTSGAENYCVNAGGDIRIRGAALPEQRWRIGIRHPIEHDKVAAVVESDDLAIATSGFYERGEHIVDPHTGVTPKGVLSVTITGPDLGTADAYATAAFAMSEEGPRWTMKLKEYESLTIFENGMVLSTPRFPRGETT